MTWIFLLKARPERYVLSRILQILETQSVTLQSLHAEIVGERLCVRCVVSSDEDLGYRIGALLGRLHDVVSVETTI